MKGLDRIGVICMLRIDGRVVGLTTKAVRTVASKARFSFKW